MSRRKPPVLYTSSDTEEFITTSINREERFIYTGSFRMFLLASLWTEKGLVSSFINGKRLFYKVYISGEKNREALSNQQFFSVNVWKGHVDKYFIQII